jgi:hypothetical protein
LNHRPWDRDAPYRQQLVQREVQANTKHQEHDANLRELRRQIEVSHEARGRGSDHDASDEVADDRRNPQPRTCKTGN